jgi:hypothetical protein
MPFQQSRHGVIVCGNRNASDWTGCLLLEGAGVGQECGSPCPSLGVISDKEAVTEAVG